MIDKTKLIEGLLHIDNKEGVVIPYKFNDVQRYFNIHKSNRNIILKARQVGISSSILADMFTDCIIIPHTSCAVVSHEIRATQRLLDRVQFYYDTMDEPKPSVGAESRSEKTFPDMHSSIYIGTAGSRAFGRGDTIRKALLSELAFYEDGNKVLSGVEDAVPLTGELTIECYDEQTEILTKRGWLPFKDVTIDDLVLSKNPSGEAYWSRISKVFSGISKEFIHITGKSIDLKVTPNHKVWARKSGTIQPFQFYEAQDLFNYSEWEFDSSMSWVGKEQLTQKIGDVSIPMPLWLEYLGYFLSEGWVEEYAVSFYQDGIYTKDMKECSERIAPYFGKESKVYSNGKQFCIHDKRLVDYLKNYTKPKRVPEEVKELPPSYLTHFLEAYWKGDGEKKRNRCVTVDIPLRDGLQEIGLKLGYRTIFHTKRAFVDRRWRRNHKESYLITFSSNVYPSVRKSRNQIRRLYEEGTVYCINIPENHLLMVRRNGKVCWSGNSTPNGEDNIFFEKWTRAREGKSPYKPFFFPWWVDKGYTIPRGTELVIPADRNELSYTGEELELINKFHLSEGQIRWRRWKMGEKAGLFYQEYPEDEVSCFITVGDPVFDQFILTSLAQSCYEGKHHEGGWTYWIPPQEKMRYVIGADSSAGAPTGSFSTAVVLNDRWEVCATFQARLDPAVFAGILKQLGLWYNRAEIAVERNFTGYAVLGHMDTYGNLYHQRDFVTGKVSTNVGWWTNESTKHYMMTACKDHLAQLKLWDVNLVRQLRSYRYIKMTPTAQTFDDLAIALMIAVAVRKVSGVAHGYMGNVPGFNW
jgi:hypothetical protein